MRSPASGSTSCRLSWTCSSPALASAADPAGIEPDARGDQIAVEPDRGGVADELDEIAADHRLAAGEMHLQHAQRRRLAEHPPPGRGVELGAGARSSASGLEQ